MLIATMKINVGAIYVKNDNNKQMRHHVAGRLILPTSARVTVIEPFPAVSVAEVDVAKRN